MKRFLCHAFQSLLALLLAANPLLALQPPAAAPSLNEETPATTTPRRENTRNENLNTNRTNQRSARSNIRDSYVRLARAPNMFGDSLRPMARFGVVYSDNTGQLSPLKAAQFTVPLGGGGSYNIAENSSALPTDRVFFMYNGFFNAIETTQFLNSLQNPQIVQSNADLHQYTVGFEKTFFDGVTSIDVRMPFNSGFQLSDPNLVTDAGRMGNLSVFLKQLLHVEESMAFTGGMGVGLPTGSDSTNFFVSRSVEVKNQAVHLMPFVALLLSPNDDWFLQTFGQLDLATSGNEVRLSNNTIGTYNEQNLLHTDATVGRWLFRNPRQRVLTGVAAILELHYTSTVQDSDRVPINNGLFVSNLQNPGGRVDLLNLTAGTHFQIGAFSNLRVGAVVPLKASPDRVFDSEVQVSFNRNF